MKFEVLLLWIALLAYVIGGVAAIVELVLRRGLRWVIPVALVAGLSLHALSLGLRWARLGHGPFITMFEILASNIFSLMLAFSIAYWRISAIRPIAAVVMPLLFIMMAWVMFVHPGEGHFPPTYNTTWLYIHIGFGKVFFGAVLVATGLATVILLRLSRLGRRLFEAMPPSPNLDELAFRLMALALVFDTLMLISGAIWAQNAWGRYWAWDPLETWAFLTWLLVAFALHLRLTLKLSAPAGSVLIISVFVVGFLTFFGIPFISMAPHQGAV